jgi:hypothetical protein
VSRDPKELPPVTAAGLTPPNTDFAYLRDAQDHPFEPFAGGFSPVNAWWLAECALLSYADEDFIRRQFHDKTSGDTPLNADCKVFMGPETGAQCLVIDTDLFAVVTFPGTHIDNVNLPDPISGLKLLLVDPADTKTDLDFARPLEGHVHPGFARAFRDVWTLAGPRITEIQQQDPSRPIWLTGHSLGAALATLAAHQLGRDAVSALYTFGSPAVGDSTFASELDVPTFRFVNNSDLIPRLPPSLPLEDYQPVGELHFIDSSGAIGPDESRHSSISNDIRSRLLALGKDLKSIQPGRLFERAGVIADEIGHGDFSGLSNQLMQVDLSLLPIEFLTDHAPINYAVRVWNFVAQSAE